MGVNTNQNRFHRTGIAAASNVSSEMVPVSARAAIKHGPEMASLVAGVAHEVNNPTAYVGANLEVLGEHVQAVEGALQEIQDLLCNDPVRLRQVQRVLEQRKLTYALNDTRAIVDENLAGLSRLSGFVRELSSFTAIDAAELESVSIDEVVSTACARFTDTPVGRRIVVEASSDAVIIAHGQRLEHAVFQLVSNALDALEGSQSPDAMVSVRTRCREDVVCISVSDSGLGIADETKRRIFEPFFSTRSGRRGLGLCLVAHTAHEHGGDVRVYSRQGEGARFDLILPLQSNLPGNVPEPLALLVPVKKG